MNAEFVQSVAHVGNYVRISLVDGNSFEGLLEELTVTRLALRQPDGMPVAVALSSLVTVAQTMPSTAVTRAEPSSVNGTPQVLPEPEHQPPPAELVAAPAVADTTVDEPADDRPAHSDPVPTVTPEDALAAVRALPITPIDMDVAVQPEHGSQLRQIRDSYQYAERINELDPKFHRTANLYTRIVYLWNADRGNPGINRLAGAMALLGGDVKNAHGYLATAANLGDVPAMLLLSITAAQLAESDAATHALLRYFQHTTPQDAPQAWMALLALLDAEGSRSKLGVLLDSPAHDENARSAVETALGDAEPDRTLAPQRMVVALPPPIRSTADEVRPARRHNTSTRSSTQRGTQDSYQRAKFMELQIKDLETAKSLYRQAIKENVKRESAVKDLAWLTRQTDGPVAALEVLEHECANMVRSGNALDNILIDFLTGARRYSEALDVLDRQSRRKDLTTRKRDHLLHQIAYIKLADGQDSTGEWKQLHEQSPHNTAVQRGLALALIQRNQPGDLDDAERLIEQHTDHRAEDITQQITALRQGGDADAVPDWIAEMLASDVPGLGDSTPPLITYVMQNYSKLADQPRPRGKRPTLREVNVLAETARQMGSKQPENSAQAYISAAVLARELGSDDTKLYLYPGLATLADLMLDRQEHESARDLYCAALAAADEHEDAEVTPDVRWALIGYVRSLNGRRTPNNRRRDRDGSSHPQLVTELARVLADELRRHGPKVLDLIPPILADTSYARDLVFEAICSRADLLEAAAAHLADGETGQRPQPNEHDVRAAWHQATVSWNRSRRRLKHEFDDLHQVAISETTLETALSRLRASERTAPESLHEGLGMINQALVELRRFTRERAFEEREGCLRSAGQLVRRLREEVKRGPTALAVELLEPITSRIQEIIADAEKRLVISQPPQPELSLALDESSGGQNGVVTVQIKVSNAAGSAPLGSPELIINAEPGVFSVAEPRIPLPTAVRGDNHRIESVRLRVSESAIHAGAFSLPVTLRYRFRSSEEYERHDATLPVRLARETEFEPIHNPYQDGATGRPVTSPNMFFGRDELIDRIRARLRNASSAGIGVAVFGQKRAGKSSIRLHLKQRLMEKDRLPVVDIGNIGDLSPTSNDQSNGTRLLALLMWRVLEGAHATYANHHEDGYIGPLIPPDLTREEFITAPDPIYDCTKIMEAHRRQANRPLPPLVVLIDEFQYLDKWIREGLLSPSFMQTFKALLERQLFHLVIVGQAGVDRLIQADSNVFGVFSTERVTYLAKEDARQLIEVPIMFERNGKETTRYHERAVDQILELTGGSAFYIQRFCDRLVEYMNAERAPVVTEADVERVRDGFLDDLETKDFENLESSGYTDSDAFTRGDYQEMLLAIARAAHNQTATMRAIREEYNGQRQMSDLLEDLVLRDVVRRDSGGYQIVVRLYQDWLLKYFGVQSGAVQL